MQCIGWWLVPIRVIVAHINKQSSEDSFHRIMISSIQGLKVYMMLVDTYHINISVKLENNGIKFVGGVLIPSGIAI